MDNKEQKELIEFIDKILEKSGKIWDDKSESHAFIIGYLEGGLKHIREKLNK